MQVLRGECLCSCKHFRKTCIVYLLHTQHRGGRHGASHLLCNVSLTLYMMVLATGKQLSESGKSFLEVTNCQSHLNCWKVHILTVFKLNGEYGLVYQHIQCCSQVCICKSRLKTFGVVSQGLYHYASDSILRLQ